MRTITPGKWFIITPKTGPKFIQVWGHGPKLVAKCGKGMQAEANAALITAAPELLDALEGSVKMIESFNKDGLSNIAVRRLNEMHRHFTVMIKKARGEK